MLAALFGLVVFVFPLVLMPGVDPPSEFRAGSLSMVVPLVNHNPFTPLTEVEYSCEIWKVTLANGDDLTDANVLVRGTLSRFEGRRPLNVRCETAYTVNAPIRAAEYRLTLSYRVYPWPQYRTAVYRIAAQVDGEGRVTGWELN